MSKAQEITVEFSVKVKYTLAEGEAFCQQSAEENLQAAIEQARKDNTLTPSNTEANWVDVNAVSNDNEPDDDTYVISVTETHYLREINEDAPAGRRCELTDDFFAAAQFVGEKLTQKTIDSELELKDSVIMCAAVD